MATLTITTAGGTQDTRIAAAVGHYLQIVGRSATMAEVKGVIIAHLKSLVLNEEDLMRKEQLAAIVPIDLT